MRYSSVTSATFMQRKLDVMDLLLIGVQTRRNMALSLWSNASVYVRQLSATTAWAKEIALIFYLQVHIIDDPTKEELGWKLEKLHPDFLLLHGECSCSKDDIGGLVLRDGSQLSADALASLYGAKVPNLVHHLVWTIRFLLFLFGAC